MSEDRSSGGALAVGGIGCLGISVVASALLIPSLLMSVVTGGLAQQEALNDGSACSSSISASGGQSPKIPQEYAVAVKSAAKVSGLPESIVAAQIQQESEWDPKAGSPVGARGLAQFIPSSWQTYGNGKDIEDPIASLEAYGRYMRDLKVMMEPLAKGDTNKLVQLTLAAYNAGPGAVQAAKGVPPFAETQAYVKKITGGAQVNFTDDCSTVAGQEWNGDLGKGEWTSPLPNSKVMSHYGPRNVAGLPAWAQQHVGVDLATRSFSYTPGGVVIAPTDVTVIGFLPKDGCVEVQQKASPGFVFLFCHMGTIKVQKGQQLKRGTVIGVEGNHGESVGGRIVTHLHFEIYKPGPGMHYPYDGTNINPEPILKAKGALPGNW
jgi:murein DD-endopeptidase MepM/ murein hydrolase activator NlpD